MVPASVFDDLISFQSIPCCQHQAALSGMASHPRAPALQQACFSSPSSLSAVIQSVHLTLLERALHTRLERSGKNVVDQVCQALRHASGAVCYEVSVESTGNESLKQCSAWLKNKKLLTCRMLLVAAARAPQSAAAIWLLRRYWGSDSWRPMLSVSLNPANPTPT